MKTLPSEGKQAAFEVGDVTTELSLPQGWCHHPRDWDAAWGMWRGRLGFRTQVGFDKDLPPLRNWLLAVLAS